MKAKIKTIIEFAQTQVRVIQSARGAVGSSIVFFTARNIAGLDEAAVSRVLGDVLKDKGMVKPLGELTVLVPRQDILLRTLLLPSQDKQELQQMALLQSSQHIPYENNDVVIDVLPVLQTPDGFSRTFLIAVPKERVNYYWRLLSANHLNPHKLTISSLGIYQWYKTRVLALDETVMVINIDEQMSEILVCDQQRIYALRAVVWGAVDSRTSQLAEICHQAQLTLNQHRKDKIGRDIASILVLSAMETDNGLCEQLTAATGLPAGLKPINQDVALKKTLAWPRALLDAGASAAACLGFALADSARPIDLIPEEVKELRRAEGHRRRLMRIIVLGVGALLSIVFASSMGLFERYGALVRWEEEIKDLKPAVERFQLRHRQVDELKDLLANRIIFAQVTALLNKLLPPDMSLLGLSIINGKTLAIQGYTRSSQNINQLQKSMADSSIFANVTLDYVNKRILDQAELNYFKITCQFKDGGK